MRRSVRLLKGYHDFAARAALLSGAIGDPTRGALDLHRLRRRHCQPRERHALGKQTFPRNGIDLPGIAFGAQTTLSYVQNAAGTGGTLTVSDGRHAASIALLGNYIAGSFAIAADGHGGTLLTETALLAQPLLAHPHA